MLTRCLRGCGCGGVMAGRAKGANLGAHRHRLERANGTKRIEFSTVTLFVGNIERRDVLDRRARNFTAARATAADGNTGNSATSQRRRLCTFEEDEKNSVVCQLFREIGDRMELTNRDRKPTAAAPRRQSASNNALQRESAASLTSEFCESYLSLPDKHPSASENAPSGEFLDLLLDEKYYVDEGAIMSVMRNDVQSRSLRNSDVLRMRELCTPRYESVFHYILGSAPRDLGVAFLVRLRRDVRDDIYYSKFLARKEKREEGSNGRRWSEEDDDPMATGSRRLNKLQTLEGNIKSILTSLFRPGVLNLRRITYQDTPAAIIEQIAFKEAVHPLQSLEDLRTRLGPGRRCFAFFHPSLPYKPLVFVHVALLREMPKSMSDLQYATESDAATCATFYSITNTEKGLTGVDLGNHLIKSVVQVLGDDFPKLSSFCTLSPVPKFKKWLEGKLVRYNEGMLRKRNGDDGPGPSHRFMDNGLLSAKELKTLERIFPSGTPLLDLLETLKSPSWHVAASTAGGEAGVSPLAHRLEPVLMKLAAYYLTIETHHGRPLCPVAKFHIRNGAEMYRLNYLADTSSTGIRSGCGMMINYHYSLDEIEENRVRYEINGDVATRDGVTRWLNPMSNVPVE